MKVIDQFDKWAVEERGIVTIGTFDGVHLGHKKLLTRLAEIKAKTGGSTMVFTFDPHPRKVLFPDQKDLQLLTTLEEKIELLNKLDLDYTVIYPFTPEFAAIEPLKFIKEILVDKLKVQTLVIGYDHKFGKDRKGDINTFRETSKTYGFKVEEVPVQEINEINVSSTKIRKALFDGDVKTASLLLGYNYFLSGEVIHGKKLGRTIGYPTANLSIKNKEKLIPKNGVYLVKVSVEAFNGYGMMNIGTNPTTDTDNKMKCEVNIFNFDKEIYTKTLRVEFIERIRDEEKFDSLEALIGAIKNDEKICKALIK
jgi:riboflavin kinase/FMN adenylyltransferase